MAVAEYLKSFSKQEYLEHVRKLQSHMDEAGVEALLLSTPENIFYATGYRSWYLSSPFRPVFAVVPREGEPAVVLRVLERTTVENSSWVEQIYASGSASRGYGGDINCADHIDGVSQFLNSLPFPVSRVGIEAGEGLHYQWSLTQFHEMAKAMDTIEFVDGSLAVQKARMIKTDWEIGRLNSAAIATEKAIIETFAEIRPGYTTEKDITSGIASRMCAYGVDKISYLTVTSGAEKAHTFNSYATSRVVEFGENVLVDISGHIDGYASDLSRVMHLDSTIPQEYQAMSDVAAEAVRAGFDFMRPGVTTGELNEVIERYIAESAFGDYLLHSSGHGIGLTVVEYPMLEPNGGEVLEAGMVFALENGVYPFDRSVGVGSIRHGFRMEDIAVVGADGNRWLSGPGQSIYSLADFI